MPRKRTASLTVSQEDLAALRVIAASNGLVIGRGKHAAMGSINKLLTAIAAGDLVVSPPPEPITPPKLGAMKVVFID